MWAITRATFWFSTRTRFTAERSSSSEESFSSLSKYALNLSLMCSPPSFLETVMLFSLYAPEYTTPFRDLVEGPVRTHAGSRAPEARKSQALPRDAMAHRSRRGEGLSRPECQALPAFHAKRVKNIFIILRVFLLSLPQCMSKNLVR